MSSRTIKALTLIFLICATAIECASLWLAAARAQRQHNPATEQRNGKQ